MRSAYGVWLDGIGAQNSGWSHGARARPASARGGFRRHAQVAAGARESAALASACFARQPPGPRPARELGPHDRLIVYGIVNMTPITLRGQLRAVLMGRLTEGIVKLNKAMAAGVGGRALDELQNQLNENLDAIMQRFLDETRFQPFPASYIRFAFSKRPGQPDNFKDGTVGNKAVEILITSCNPQCPGPIPGCENCAKGSCPEHDVQHGHGESAQPSEKETEE